MIETILIARKRKSGEQVVLLGSNVEFNKQREKLHSFSNEFHEEYDTVGLYQLVPCKKVLRFDSKGAYKAAQEKTAADNKLQAVTEHLSKHSLEDLQRMAARLKLPTERETNGGSVNARKVPLSRSELVQALLQAEPDHTKHSVNPAEAPTPAEPPKLDPTVEEFAQAGNDPRDYPGEGKVQRSNSVEIGQCIIDWDAGKFKKGKE